MTIKHFFIVLSIIIFLISSGCRITDTGNGQQVMDSVSASDEAGLQEEYSSGDAQNYNDEEMDTGPAYLEEYEGLHITGTVVEVDIDSYRLQVTGAVKNPIELTFDEVKQLPPEREYLELDCPGFFVDEGYWTGARVSDLLDMAVLDDDAKRVRFISIDGKYFKTFKVEEIESEYLLIAYHFNDEEFSKYHGYPLRLAVKDFPGSYWVKWLGEIKVFDK